MKLFKVNIVFLSLTLYFTNVILMWEYLKTDLSYLNCLIWGFIIEQLRQELLAVTSRSMVLPCLLMDFTIVQLSASMHHVFYLLTKSLTFLVV